MKSKFYIKRNILMRCVLLLIILFVSLQLGALGQAHAATLSSTATRSQQDDPPETNDQQGNAPNNVSLLPETEQVPVDLALTSPEDINQKITVSNELFLQCIQKKGQGLLAGFTSAALLGMLAKWAAGGEVAGLGVASAVFVKCAWDSNPDHQGVSSSPPVQDGTVHLSTTENQCQEASSSCLRLILATLANTQNDLVEQMCVVDQDSTGVPGVTLNWRVSAVPSSQNLISDGTATTGADGCQTALIPVKAIELNFAWGDQQLEFEASNAEVSGAAPIYVPWCYGLTADMPRAASRATCLPYVVYLQTTFADGRVSSCSGSLVENNASRLEVLTNAHCAGRHPSDMAQDADTPAKQIVVSPGLVILPDTSSTPTMPFGSCTVKAKDIHMAPNFRKDSNDMQGDTDLIQDYAVLELKGKGCTFPDLNSESAYKLSSDLLKGGTKVYTIGYGGYSSQYASGRSAGRGKTANENMYYKLSIAGEAGRSGSPLFAGTVGDGNAIISGIFNAGDDEWGYAVKITNGIIDFIRNPPKLAYNDDTGDDTEVAQADGIDGNVCSSDSTLDQQEACFDPGNTGISNANSNISLNPGNISPIDG